MKRAAIWLVVAILVPVLLLGIIAGLLHHYVGTPEFRARLAQQVSGAIGLPVELAGVDIDVWPLPAVSIDRLVVKSKPPVTLEHLEVRPTWASLLQRKVEIATLLVRDAVVPQEAIGAIAAAVRRTKPADRKGAASDTRETLAMLPRRIVLDRVTWVDTRSNRSVIDAEWRLDETDGLPSSIEVAVREGRFQGAQVQVLRAGEQWNVDARLAGGTIKGQLVPQKGAKGEPLLDGKFDAANVEVSALTAPSRTLTGRLQAHTTLRADLRDLGGITETLVTNTRFTVQNAVVHGVDLAQAVKTVGVQRSGETRLDTLAGNVSTRGRAVQLNNLVATSGALSANGAVAMSPEKKLSGQMTVSLVGQSAAGTLGVPLVVGGTLDSPSVTLSRGALLGAAIGTAIAPGLGTGAGASLGDKLGKGLGSLLGK